MPSLGFLFIGIAIGCAATLALYKAREVDMQKWADASYREWQQQPEGSIKISSKGRDTVFVTLTPTLSDDAFAVMPGETLTMKAPAK